MRGTDTRRDAPAPVTGHDFVVSPLFQPLHEALDAVAGRADVFETHAAAVNLTLGVSTLRSHRDVRARANHRQLAQRRRTPGKARLQSGGAVHSLISLIHFTHSFHSLISLIHSVTHSLTHVFPAIHAPTR